MMLEKDLEKGKKVYFLLNNKVEKDIIKEYKEFEERNDKFIIQVYLENSSSCFEPMALYSSKKEAKKVLKSIIKNRINDAKKVILEEKEKIKKLKEDLSNI